MVSTPLAAGATVPDGETQFLSLPDGRRFCYMRLGDPQAPTIIYNHGFPSCRLEARLAADAARRCGVALLVPDRPGFGRSDFQPGRTIGDWADDVNVLVDRLGLNRFSLIGVSGGAPYAIASALRFADRVDRLALVSGLGPLDAPHSRRGMSFAAARLIDLARTVPQLVRPLNRWLAAGLLCRMPRAVFRLLAGSLPAADRAALRDRTVMQWLIANVREALCGDGRGAAWELELIARPWNIDPARVSVATDLWHGEADTVVPVAAGRRMAAAIAGCHARFLPGEGHYSVPINHMDTILGAMTP